MLSRIVLLGVLACLAAPALASEVVITTPEPASLALLAAGVAGAAVVRAVRKRRS